MEIKTKYVEKINEEKQGIELYFEAIPTAEERTILKNNGYRWNNAKKCWYIKKNKIVEPIQLGTSEIENSYSGYGWKGCNSNKHLSMVEIAKIIKDYCVMRDIEIWYWDSTQDIDIPIKASPTDMGRAKYDEIIREQLVKINFEEDL